MDAARWVRPEGVAELSELSFFRVLMLLYRHLPLRAMAWFRLASFLQNLSVPGGPGLVQRRLLVRFGLEMVPGAAVGGGLYIAHPVGCTLVAASIGENVTVISDVTFGVRDRTWPRIGNGVYVGAGARVIGGITVGEGVRIGANAVVLRDVPPGVTVVGVPATQV
jgi:serine O-acetyltransferase